ncbi:MAG: diguanylate cyclase [Rhodospirillaceae bacterium]|nr:diguanylate cyclase [Rhodospirillaceae bacterium]
MRRAEEIAHLGWYDYDIVAGTLHLTPEFAAHLGFPLVPSGLVRGAAAAAYVEQFRAAIHPDDRDRYASIIADDKWLRTEFDFRIVTPANDVRHMFTRIHRTVDAAGRRIRDFGVILDITERKRLEEDLRALALTDPLTGVPNRRTFEASGRREVERARRYAKPFSIIVIDIDHFKRVNDTYGHDVGDVVLKEVAKVCAAQLRGTDIFARFGGEEFIALLPETDLKAGMILAERLRQAVGLQPIFSHKGPVVVTASLGLAAYLPQDKSLEDAVKRADEALYAAKRSGRNRVEIALVGQQARPAAE